MVRIGRGIKQAENAATTDPFLKKMALSTLLWTLLFGLGLSL
jgi:1,4-dihydroxy-2-naphthoate octaprenyltransferase